MISISVEQQYEVLKIVEKNNRCHLCSDIWSGTIMVRWLKYHPILKKEVLFSFMKHLTRVLEQYHRSRGRPAFGHVNPFCMIVTTEQKIALIDVRSEANLSHISCSEGKNVRHIFLPPQEQNSTRVSQQGDIYGYGRSIQYILAHAEIEPPLTLYEEHKLKQIITKCLKSNSNKQYSNFQEIRNHIPEIKKKKPIRFICTGGLLFVLLLTAFAFLFPKRQIVRNKEVLLNNQEKEVCVDQEKEALILDMGILQFTEVKNYSAAMEKLQPIVHQNNKAKTVFELSAFLAGKSSCGKEEIGRILEELSKEVKREKDIRYVFIVMETAMQLDTECGYRILTEVGNECETWIESEEMMLRDTQKKELKENIAVAYEKQEQKEEAAKRYVELGSMKINSNEKEGYYKKAILLYEAQGNAEEKWKTFSQAILEMPDSKDLRIHFIQAQCQDQETDQETCTETIRAALSAIPELVYTEEFMKLQEEYGIQMEGDTIWIENGNS